MNQSLTEGQIQLIAATVAKAVVVALSSGEAETEAVTDGKTHRQQPRRNGKAKAAAKPTKTAPAVRRLAGFEEAKTSTTAASLRKGHVFVLRSNGAMYTVKSVLRTASKVTLSTDHPKVEQMTLNGDAVVTLCYAK